MTVGELIEKLEDFGDHLIIKVVREDDEISADITEVTDFNGEDGTIVELNF